MRALSISLLALTMLVWSYAGSAAVQTVTGIVVDPQGAVVGGANVTLKATGGFSRSVATDAKGAFTFEGVPIGHATLTVALAGFATHKRELSIDASRAVSVKVVLAPA